MSHKFKIFFFFTALNMIYVGGLKAQLDGNLLEGYRYETPSGQRIPTNLNSNPLNTEDDELLQMNRPYDPNEENYYVPPGW